jgi:hypothetical protein
MALKQLTIKDAARSYWEVGINVLPAKGKDPDINPNWGRWIEQRQTQQEFEDLPWVIADSFGLICGVETGNGYFCAVDVDREDWRDFELEHLRTTQFEKSPHGLHALYYSCKPVRGSKHHEIGLELFGKGNFIVMAPSPGYQTRNQNLPTVIDDAELMFQELVSKLGGDATRRGRQPLGEVIKPQTKGNRNQSIYDFATKQRDAHVEFEIALSLAQKLNKDNTPPLAESEVNTTVRSAYEHPLKEVPDNDQLPEVEHPNKEISIEELQTILGTTVVKDDTNKILTFLPMLLTYTEADQINIGFVAESSTGKSYIPIELSHYFPQEDIISLSYASKKSFFHEKGKWDKDPVTGKHYKVLDLSKHILIFKDQPHPGLLEAMRSLLSHDEKIAESKITDRSEKFGTSTKTIKIIGFPTVIFCTAKPTLEEQEKTRLLILSPEIDTEKLRESIMLRIKRESNRKEFISNLKNDQGRALLVTRILDIKNSGVDYVNIPENKQKEIYSKFTENKNLLPRHQRDISRLLSIIKGVAILNFHSHERLGDSITVSQEDIDAGFELYSQVMEANEKGLSPELYKLYEKLKPYFYYIIEENGAEKQKPKWFTRREFQSAYAKEFHKPLAYKRVTAILEAYTDLGILNAQVDPEDNRRTRYIPPD